MNPLPPRPLNKFNHIDNPKEYIIVEYFDIGYRSREQAIAKGIREIIDLCAMGDISLAQLRAEQLKEELEREK